ncbi:DNA fragmentation factor subunit alpha isoform 2-T2 [Megaptera novaeangliae]
MTEVAGGPSVPEPSEIRALKQCLLCRNHGREQHGVAASCLEELRSKACDILAIDKSLAPVTLVLAEDGTIVDDDDYFLCLPANTKFVALAGNEKWAYNNSELAQELSQSRVAVQGLQNTLQQVLDQREEARQSKQLLELYLRALEKEGSILLKQQESKAGLGDERDAVDTGIGESSSEIALTSQILTALKEKPAPELSLSSQDLELVAKEDPKALAVALNWDIKKTEAVQQTCNQELSLRLQQVQSLYSLRSISARKSSLPGEVQNPKQAKRDPT